MGEAGVEVEEGVASHPEGGGVAQGNHWQRPHLKDVVNSMLDTENLLFTVHQKRHGLGVNTLLNPEIDEITPRLTKSVLY